VAMVLDGDGLPQKDDTIKECTKRPNKDGANSTSLGSAGSQEEPVRHNENIRPELSGRG
jgi:hypothetical protein